MSELAVEMADGGAWQSGVYDNGRDINNGHKARADAGNPVPGVPAGMYNPPSSMQSGKDGGALTIISFALRGATILFTTIAFAIIAGNSGSDWNDSWRALNTSQLEYLLAIDIIVCVYSIVQLVFSIVSACNGSPVLKGPKSPAATITFICDQVLTYMLMAGCGAGAALSMFYQKGESGALSCGDGFANFCSKNAAAVAMSFLAFACIALSTAMAYFRLFRMA